MDGRWMTYAELGELMGGKSPNAGRQRANRKKYRKQAGNDGRARVFVPPDDLAELEARPVADQADHPAEHPHGHVAEHPAGHLHDHAAGPVIGPLLERLAMLETELAAMALRAGAAEALVSELRSDRDAWRAQAERFAERRPGLIERLAAVLRRAG